MSPLVMSTLRPRRSPAVLVAAVAGIAVAVSALVAPPRFDRGRAQPTRCPAVQDGDYVRSHCAPPPIAMEIEQRFADPGFAQPPPLSEANGCGLRAPVGPVPSYVPR